jgi:hypothetical protein
MNKKTRTTKKASRLTVRKDTIRYLASNKLAEVAGGKICWFTCADNGTVSGGYPCCTNSAVISW